jgi:hypothetical protein
LEAKARSRGSSSDRVAMVVDGHRFDTAARVHIDPLTSQVTLETHWYNYGQAPEQWIPVFWEAAAIRSCDKAFQCERAVRWVPRWHMQRIVEAAVGFDSRIDAVEAEG